MKNNKLLIEDILRNQELEDFFLWYFYKKMDITTKITIDTGPCLNIEETASVSSVYYDMGEESANVKINATYCQFLWGIIAYVVISNFYALPKRKGGGKKRHSEIMDKLYILINESQTDENYFYRWDVFMREELNENEFELVKIISQLAISFILAHECAHVRLGHGEEEIKDEEYEADAYAYWNTTQHKGTFSLSWEIAIISVYLSFIFLDEFQESDSHPFSHERLFKYLNDTGANDDAWITCCIGLGLHMKRMNCICVRKKQTTGKEHFMNMIEVLSNAHNATQ